jgi:hypothetical protein
MKDTAITPEIADPYAALETILKIIGRSWLSEEWRLEDIRLLAQEALASRGLTVKAKRTGTAAPSLQPQIRVKAGTRPGPTVRRSEQLPS